MNEWGTAAFAWILIEYFNVAVLAYDEYFVNLSTTLADFEINLVRRWC